MKVILKLDEQINSLDFRHQLEVLCLIVDMRLELWKRQG
jgi:ABC-type cobalamin/Fe3+-siderophores transport system ATPase subunit